MPIITNSATAIQNTPDGLASVNALGSEYAQQYSQAQSPHYALQVQYEIIDNSPRRYLDLQVMRNWGSEGNPGDEFMWNEHLWARSPAVVNADAAAVPAVGVTVVTQDVVVTASSLNVFKVDRGVVYPDGTIGVVTAVDTGTNTLTISSQYGEGLPAVTSGETLSDAGVIGADGLQRIQMTQRSQYIQIVNYIEKLGGRQVKYDFMELTKVKNTGQTNKMESDQRDAEQGLLTDIACKVWLGRKGQMQMSAGEILKNTGGISYQLETGGSPFVTATTGNVWDVLTQTVFATDYCAAGTTRFLFGAPQTINALNLASGKPQLVRYTPESKMRDLDLNAYVFNQRQIVPVEVPLFNDPGSFPAIYRNRLFLLDPSHIKMQNMTGVPVTRNYNWGVGQTNNGPLGVTYESIIRGWDGTVGMKVENRPAHAVIDIAA